MSLVIAIKDKNGIYLGADKMTTYGGLRDNNTVKLAEHSSIKGLYVGSSGYARDFQIVTLTSDLIENKLSTLSLEYIATEVYLKIYERIKKYNTSYKKEDELYSDFLIAYKNKCFKIFSDGYTEELTEGNYLVLGSGSEVAIGSLENSKHLDPKTRIEQAIEAAASKTNYVNDKIDYFELKTK